MASVITHGIVAATLTAVWPLPGRVRGLYLVAGAVSILPDADVIGFFFGIPYQSIFGHRGITHSLLFAVVIGVLTAAVLKAGAKDRVRPVSMSLFLAIVTASHGLLDALTNGGLGVAFFGPFDPTRYFFPWTPIQVSPIGIEAFFSSWGAAVLISEALWVWIPCAAVLAVARRLGRSDNG